MFETVINLKPESEWRKGMTVEKLKDEMNDALIHSRCGQFLYDAH
jgi:Cu(I)/Ag(I) efflux system membrane protein CusA/SilA